MKLWKVVNGAHWIGGHSSSIILFNRSEKLKPFWLSLSDEDLSSLNVLSDALLSREPTPEYREAVTRALDISGCPTVPFFGSFLRDLRSILSGVPSIIVVPNDENHHIEVIIKIFHKM